MAIKIDLLPAYVKLRRDLHRSIAASIVVFGLVLGGLLMVLQKRQLELQTTETNLKEAKVVADKTDAAQEDTATTNTTATTFVSAVNFMAAASKTGSQRAALLALVRQHIYEDAIISSVDISDGQRVLIKATVRNPDEYARFLNNLRHGADVEGGVLFKGLPTATGPGGFANGAVPFLPPVPNGQPSVPIIYPISVQAEGTLLNPIQIPPEPGAAAPTAPGGPPVPGDPSLARPQ